MNKLKNTTKNKSIVLATTVIGMSILGYIGGKGNDKKSFAKVGALVGLMMSLGMINIFVESDKK
jgi:hypothetical protein